MKRWRTNGHWAGWFYCETYKSNVEIVWPIDGAKLAVYIKRRFGLEYETADDFGAKCIQVTQDGADTNIVCLRQWKATPYDVSCLAHEVFHCAEHILSSRSVALEPKHTEPYAYLIEEITRRCVTLLNR